MSHKIILNNDVNDGDDYDEDNHNDNYHKKDDDVDVII